MKAEIPQSIQVEHENLKADFKNVIASGGKVAQKAEILADVLYPHFTKEEETMLPQLGLLLILAGGKWDIESEDILLTADRLQAEFQELKKEHEKILKALEGLKSAAKEENNFYAEKFVYDLSLHAQIEEQVLYPAVVVIGRYLDHIKHKK